MRADALDVIAKANASPRQEGELHMEYNATPKRPVTDPKSKLEAARPAKRDGEMVYVGLIGRGIQGSRSPAMHMAEGRAQGMRLTYVLMDLDQPALAGVTLQQVMDRAERDGFSGLNITYPFKQDVMPMLTDLSPDARRMGAVNTVVFRDGKRFGHNTDWSGYAEAFRRGLGGVALDWVVQVGAGGAGRAVAFALLQEGVQRLTIFDLDAARAKDLVDTLIPQFADRVIECGTDLTAAMAGANGLVNTTPVGMTKYPGVPVPLESLHPKLWVSEIIYFPLVTELLKAARDLGCRTLDGGGMAVFQGVEGFTLMTGVEADADRMHSEFLEALTRPNPDPINLKAADA
jgi:shikimate dehydrogenase